MGTQGPVPSTGNNCQDLLGHGVDMIQEEREEHRGRAERARTMYYTRGQRRPMKSGHAAPSAGVWLKKVSKKRLLYLIL